MSDAPLISAQTHSMMAVIHSPAGSTVVGEVSPPAPFHAAMVLLSSSSEYGCSGANVCNHQHHTCDTLLTENEAHFSLINSTASLSGNLACSWLSIIPLPFPPGGKPFLAPEFCSYQVLSSISASPTAALPNVLGPVDSPAALSPENTAGIPVVRRSAGLMDWA